MSNANTNNPNPWVVQQGGGQAPLPRGMYIAEFVNAELVKVPERQGSTVLMDRIRWTWKVATGTHAGKLATPITDPSIKPTNKAGRFISGMAGRDIQMNENVLPLIESFKGKRYAITVAPGPQGGKEGVQAVGPIPE
ncbi:MAG: hypothetical protein U0871_27440 [Gemmataceae bacterium]